MKWIAILALVANFVLASAALGKAPPAPLDLNKASAQELVLLPGVGPARADAILRQREKRPFRKVSELLKVKGFGRAMVSRIGPHVYVGDAPMAPAVVRGAAQP